MKKYLGLTLLFLITLFALGGCGNKALDEAKTAVDAYNTKAAEYNAEVAPYNEAVFLIVEENQKLQGTIDDVQEVLNKGETPYDPETVELLKVALSNAVEAKVEEPETIPEYEIITLNEEAKTSELKSITEQVSADIVAIDTFELPKVPEIVDYSSVLTALTDSLNNYEDSVQSLKQVTAPADDFVIARLQTIETIIEIDAVTEEHDPNGKLNKQGGYIGCIYFSDSQVNKSNLYIEAGKNNVIDIGTAGGGCVEIFNNVEDAETRDLYLGSFDGTAFASGSHYIVGTCLVRTSDELNGTQQKELTDLIFEALLNVEH